MRDYEVSRGEQWRGPGMGAEPELSSGQRVSGLREGRRVLQRFLDNEGRHMDSIERQIARRSVAAWKGDEPMRIVAWRWDNAPPHQVIEITPQEG